MIKSTKIKSVLLNYTLQFNQFIFASPTKYYANIIFDNILFLKLTGKFESRIKTASHFRIASSKSSPISIFKLSIQIDPLYPHPFGATKDFNSNGNKFFTDLI